MKKSFVILLTSTLLVSTSSVVVFAMDIERNNITSSTPKRTLPQLSLGNAVQAFENDDMETATELFKQLREAGSFTPIEYLKQMGHDPLLWGFESQKDIEASKNFYKASLAYKKYKKTADKKELLTLGTYVLGGNPHAISLINKLYQENNKILSILQSDHKFKTIKTIDQLSKGFSFNDCKLNDCLDVDNILNFYPNIGNNNATSALKSLKDNYEKYPGGVGKLALLLAKLYKDQPFWAHL